MALIEKLNAIGDAIRNKSGTTELIPLVDMPQAILDIVSGGAEYEDIKFNEDNSVTLTDKNGVIHTMECEYTDGKLTSVKYDGRMVDLTYDGDVLVKVGRTEAAFEAAFVENKVSNEAIWADGVAYRVSVIQGEYVAALTGEFTKYSSWSRTDYINCEGCSTIYFPPIPEEGNDANDPGSNAFYDSNKTRICNFALSRTQGATITVPENACYFAISSSTVALLLCLNDGIIPYD